MVSPPIALIRAAVLSGKEGNSVLREFLSGLAHTPTDCVHNSARTCGAYFGVLPAVPNNSTSFLWDWGPVILQARETSAQVLHHAY